MKHLPKKSILFQINLKIYFVFVFILSHSLIGQTYIDEIDIRIKNDPSVFLAVYKTPESIIIPDESFFVEIDNPFTGLSSTPKIKIIELQKNRSYQFMFTFRNNGQRTSNEIKGKEAIQDIIAIIPENDPNDPNQVALKSYEISDLLPIMHKAEYKDFKRKIIELIMTKGNASYVQVALERRDQLNKEYNNLSINPNKDNTNFVKENKIISPFLYDKNTIFSSDLSISRSAINFGSFDNVPGDILGGITFGFEFSRNEKTLNILPWQNNSYYLGGRFLFRTDPESINSTFFDLRAYYKGKSGASKSGDFFAFNYDRSSNLNSPHGIAIDFYFASNPWFVNLFYSNSNKNFEEPISYLSNNDQKSRALFSLSQYEFSLLNNLISSKNHSLSAGIGGGFYDIWDVNYVNNSPEQYSRIYAKIHLLAQINYIFFTEEDNELLGANVKYIDGRMKFYTWLQLFEIQNTIGKLLEIRAESYLLTNRLITNNKIWDASDGATFSLRAILEI